MKFYELCYVRCSFHGLDFIADAAGLYDYLLDYLDESEVYHEICNSLYPSEESFSPF